MFKFFRIVGFVACITLLASCFMPWTYYADIDKTFTGFFSEQNSYGKPGLLLTIITLLIFIFMILPAMWAKRANLFLSALLVGYAIKSFVLFTACYPAGCPQKKVGVILMITSSIVILVTNMLYNPTIKADKQD